jgi:hypothetical protein
MRLLTIGALVLVVFPEMVCGLSGTAAAGQGPENSVAIYDSNPAHLWNRLHSAMFIREDLPDTKLVPDALDPPLWDTSEYLLKPPSHERLLRILDEFLQTHGEKLIRDPLKRAIMLRDLWSVFDWSVQERSSRTGEPGHLKEKRELQSRLAEVMRRLALTAGEIRSLPTNYARAVASGKFAAEYDPAHREQPFLPPDLFEARGPWVRILETGPGYEPVAKSHADAFSRSGFPVFVRLPDGRKATYDYIRSLWDFAQPWIQRDDSNDARDQTIVNPNLPPLPKGTQVALVRQMMLFDNQGNLHGTPITESVQIRVYRRSATGEDVANSALNFDRGIEATGQDFYEIKLSRPQLFAGDAGGLRATGRDEKEFAMFMSHPADMFGANQQIPLEKYRPVLDLCSACHRTPGINSLNTRGYLLKPHSLQVEPPEGGFDPHRPWWDFDEEIAGKRSRYDWGLLNGYWNLSAPRER